MSSVECKDFTLFQDAISNLETSFIVHEVHEDMIKFTHSSVQNALFSVVGKHYPDDLIKYCDYTLLSLITTSQYLVKGITMIVISDQCSLILRDRILELLTSGSSKVLRVVSELNVLKDKAFFMKCQEFEKSFVEAVDENDWLLYVHFAAVGCIKWVKHLFNQISNNRQLILALEVACGSNKLRVVKFLLENNIQPNIRCCFNAVRGGYLDILIALVEAHVDLCELDKTETYWKIRSHSLTIMDEAALFNQCHLIGPLLKLCPKLIDCKSSCGTTVIHALAMAGNLELLKNILHVKRFPLTTNRAWIQLSFILHVKAIDLRPSNILLIHTQIYYFQNITASLAGQCYILLHKVEILRCLITCTQRLLVN
ncbi:ANK [Mytilus edulis]|uniref:ANK n=1 Tax=Mytilus edulis TaxID=6550 RepID=A0A8S3S419_MYTED|nr:ANK [Mytilus edulis]